MSKLQIYTKGCSAVAGQGASLSVLSGEGEILSEIELSPGPLRFEDFEEFEPEGGTLALSGCLIARPLSGRAAVMRQTGPVRSAANPDFLSIGKDTVQQMQRQMDRLTARLDNSERRNEHERLMRKRRFDREKAKLEAEEAEAKAKAEAEAEAQAKADTGASDPGDAPDAQAAE